MAIWQRGFAGSIQRSSLSKLIAQTGLSVKQLMKIDAIKVAMMRLIWGIALLNKGNVNAEI
jgi:hypothetical protein